MPVNSVLPSLGVLYNENSELCEATELTITHLNGSNEHRISVIDENKNTYVTSKYIQ